MVFGFGKKKLSEPMKVNLAMEVAMYMRWGTENDKGVLPGGSFLQSMEVIIAGVLKRENYRYTDDDISVIKIHAMTLPLDRVDEMRKTTRFDEQVQGFERSIGLRG